MEGEGIDGDVQKKYPFREKFQYHCKHYFKHSFTVHSETEYFTWKTPFFFSSNSSLPDSRKKKAIPTLTFPVYISRIFFPEPWSLWMCFRPWTWKHVGCMTCESLSHLREWLYPQGTKCGKKTLSSCKIWEDLSQTVSDLEKDWYSQKPSWFFPPNSFSFSLGRCCSTLPTFLHLGLDHASSKIWARLQMWWRVIYHRAFGLLFNNKALLLGGIWAMQRCILVRIHACFHTCIQLTVPREHSSHNPALSGFSLPAI